MGIFKKLVNHTISLGSDYLGEITGTRAVNKATRDNNALQQRNFENQTQIRVQDALKAGINPLAALGISSGYQPSFSQEQASSGSDLANVVSTIGSVASGAGKGVSSLVRFFTGAAKEEKMLSLDHARLQNDYLRAQIAHLNHLSTTGRGRTGKDGTMPLPPGYDPTVYGDYIPTLSLGKTPSGDMDLPSDPVADRLDVDFGIINPLAWEWWFRTKGKKLKDRFISNIYDNSRWR